MADHANVYYIYMTRQRPARTTFQWHFVVALLDEIERPAHIGSRYRVVLTAEYPRSAASGYSPARCCPTQRRAAESRVGPV